MTKQEAIDIFGNQTKLARALGITASAVSQWSPILTDAQADRVVGAAVRVGMVGSKTRCDDKPRSTEAA